MKISGLNFLGDLEKRLTVSINSTHESPKLEFHRFLNFSEKTLVFQVGWPGIPLGKLACRVVDEPQDFYFRGTFQPASSESTYPFTLRPGKDYDKDLSLLVEAIAGLASRTMQPVPQPADLVSPAALETLPKAPPQKPPKKPAQKASGSTPGKRGLKK